MQITVHAAKTQLSKLIDAAIAGEDVVIAKGRHPVVRLVPVRKGQFKLGVLEDHLNGRVPDFSEPLTDADLDMWEGR